jgi:hypothetical protein
MRYSCRFIHIDTKNGKRLNVVGYWGIEDGYDDFFEYWNWNLTYTHGWTPKYVLTQIDPIIEYYETNEQTEKINDFLFRMRCLRNMCAKLKDIYEEQTENIFLFCDEYRKTNEQECDTFYEMQICENGEVAVKIIRHNFDDDKINEKNIYGCHVENKEKCVVQVDQCVSETGIKVIDDNFY